MKPNFYHPIYSSYSKQPSEQSHKTIRVTSEIVKIPWFMELVVFPATSDSGKVNELQYCTIFTELW